MDEPKAVSETGMSGAEERRHWHMGFYSGMEVELHPWKDCLEFSDEYPLTRKALVADMRIIKKKPGAVIDHPIGKSFRGHNLVEYKSPSDTLSIDAFSKAVSYAYLYKSQGETENAVPFQEMTLTLFCYHYPRKLFAELQAVGAAVENESEGICKVNGFPGIPVHVIVIPELPKRTHAALRILRPHADLEDAEALEKEIPRLEEEGERHNIDALLHLSVRVNPGLYRKLSGDKTAECGEEDADMLDISSKEADLLVERFIVTSLLKSPDIQNDEKAYRKASQEYLDLIREEVREKVSRETAEKDRNDFITRMLQDHAPLGLIQNYTQASAEKIMEVARSIGVTPVA